MHKVISRLYSGLQEIKIATIIYVKPGKQTATFQKIPDIELKLVIWLEVSHQVFHQVQHICHSGSSSCWWMCVPRMPIINHSVWAWPQINIFYFKVYTQPAMEKGVFP